ncbi:MAG: HIT domain-containing protein [Spirochaetota bacterium]
MNYFFNFEKLSYVKKKRNNECILCLIIGQSKDVPDLTIFRSTSFIISVNLYPYNPGHLLIFPKRHIEDIRNYTEKEELELAKLIKTFLDILDDLHNPSGYNIGYNMGLVAGASINHLHLHIIPRYPSETGIADLIAGKRVLVENPFETAEKIKQRIAQSPRSIFEI